MLVHVAEMSFQLVAVKMKVAMEGMICIFVATKIKIATRMKSNRSAT